MFSVEVSELFLAKELVGDRHVGLGPPLRQVGVDPQAVPVHQAVDVVEDRGVAPLVPALGAEATTPVQDVLLVDVPFTALAAGEDVAYPVLAVGTSEKMAECTFIELQEFTFTK